ncbi:MAG: endonuclease domain-containing protein [candidate division SR1 bacterium]|nr:endonuclease domain-containing protein [candidate division SR1 bacterium]
MYFYYKNHLKNYSQTNRKTPTKSEGLFWNMLLKSNRTGYRFLRQKPIEGYILDFYCPKLKLGIEIDGISHEGKGDYDEKRDSLLQSLGIQMVRYHDNDILKKLEPVSLHLHSIIEDRVKELKL